VPPTPKSEKVRGYCPYSLEVGCRLKISEAIKFDILYYAHRRHQADLTHRQGFDLTSIHVGSIVPGDQGLPGFVKWRLMLESLLTRHGMGHYRSRASRQRCAYGL